MFESPPCEVAMKRLVALAALVAAAPISGQQVQQQATTIAFPTFTTDQNWTRASTLLIANQVVGYAFAKARGVSPEEYGRIGAETFAPGWGTPESGSAIRYARGIQNNWRSYAGGVAEVLSVSDTMIVMRASRPYVSYFGPTKQVYGVTLDEFEAVSKAFNEGIGRYLGLHYEDRVDSAWVTMTIRGRGKNAVNDFPRSTYTIVLTPQDPGVNPGLVGTSEVTFGPNGRYAIQHDGKPFLQADYDLAFDEIVFRNAPGADCTAPGRYRWTVNPANGNLSLGRLSDDCTQRAAFFTRRAFTKK
jgi:hypothetical protein